MRLCFVSGAGYIYAFELYTYEQTLTTWRSNWPESSSYFSTCKSLLDLSKVFTESWLFVNLFWFTGKRVYRNGEYGRRYHICFSTFFPCDINSLCLWFICYYRNHSFLRFSFEVLVGVGYYNIFVNSFSDNVIDALFFWVQLWSLNMLQYLIGSFDGTPFVNTASKRHVV